MKFVSFEYEGRESFGAVMGERVIDLCGLASATYPDLRSLLAVTPARLEDLIATGPSVDLEKIRFRPVIPNPSKIVCVGLNYHEHVGETGRAPSSYPVLFLRLPESQVGHLQPLVRPCVSEQLDFEGELAVIIGRRGRYIPKGRALDYVAGYSIYNEASIRDWQKHTHQYTAGKNFSGTGAFGPWLVTTDEVPNPHRLTLTTRLNGKIMQHASTADMIFPIEQLLAYISTITELLPGDVLVTGTPSGVGGLRNPAVWMQPGDLVEVEISQLGVLRNPIVAEAQETI